MFKVYNVFRFDRLLDTVAVNLASTGGQNLMANNKYQITV